MNPPVPVPVPVPEGWDIPLLLPIGRVLLPAGNGADSEIGTVGMLGSEIGMTGVLDSKGWAVTVIVWTLVTVIVTGSGQVDPAVGLPGKPSLGKGIPDIPLGNTPGTTLGKSPGPMLEVSSGVLLGDPSGMPVGEPPGTPLDEPSDVPPDVPSEEPLGEP